MSHFPLQDIEDHVKGADANASADSGAPSLVTAAGTGDNTKVTGQSIDRLGYQSAVLMIQYLAALTAAKTISFAVEYQDSADNSNWNTAVVMQAATVAATGAGNKRGVVELGLSLKMLERYVRFNITPDLSHSGTDTATFAAVCVLGGADVLPAA